MHIYTCKDTGHMISNAHIYRHKITHKEMAIQYMDTWTPIHYTCTGANTQMDLHGHTNSHIDAHAWLQELTHMDRCMQ